MKHAMVIFVPDQKGTEWAFEFRGDLQNLAEWQAAGLNVYEVQYKIPGWVVSIGLMRPWQLVQRVWRWLRFW